MIVIHSFDEGQWWGQSEPNPSHNRAHSLGSVYWHACAYICLRMSHHEILKVCKTRIRVYAACAQTSDIHNARILLFWAVQGMFSTKPFYAKNMSKHFNQNCKYLQIIQKEFADEPHHYWSFEFNQQEEWLMIGVTFSGYLWLIWVILVVWMDN